MGVTVDNKINNTEAGYQNISNLEGDTLIGTVAQNKAEFDAYPNLIKDHFNNLVDDIILDKESTATSFSGKVDKVNGKGLSTNDYTTAEKNKLAGIASGAEVNVQADWAETNTSSDAYIKNKPNMPSTLSASNGIKIENNVIKHTNSIQTGTIGQTGNTSGNTFNIPYAYYDNYGHIIGKGQRTHTVPLSSYVLNSRTINGHALNANVTLTASDISGASSYFDIESYTTSNVSIPANNYADVEKTETKSGYTPIGIVGIEMSGDSGFSSCTLVRYFISARSNGSVTYKIRYYNNSNTAKTLSISPKILWVKS